MKKLFSILFCIIYLITSSTVVHGFCLNEQEHDFASYMEEPHSCCDFFDTKDNCLDACISNDTDLHYVNKKPIAKQYMANISLV